MLWRAIVYCLVILATAGSLLAHPTHLAEMSYSGPESVEEDRLGSRDGLDIDDGGYLSQETPGFGYPSLLTGEINRDGSLQTEGFVPDQVVKELLLKRPVVNPLSRFLGSRRQYRKRGSNNECFWKYCV